jgi:hypothetical protein
MGSMGETTRLRSRIFTSQVVLGLTPVVPQAGQQAGLPTVVAPQAAPLVEEQLLVPVPAARGIHEREGASLLRLPPHSCWVQE